MILLFGHRPDGCGQAHSCELGRPCRRNQFFDRISNPILGSSTRASFAGRQQVASGFSQTRIAMMAETGEMVGASFLSICVTVGAASFGPPKARNLLSSALPFNVVAPLFPLFWWVWRQLAAHPTSEPTPKPQTTWHSSETHPPQTVSKTAQEPTSHPLVFIIHFIRGKGDAVGNIETLASIIQRL